MLDILLTTFNGEKYLADQLDSIFSQNYSEWRLIVRDDGSIDSTPKILESYRNKYPDKVVIIFDAKSNVGVVQSFSFLMLESDAEYIAFCDQDDIWKPEKLDLQIRAIKQAEKNHGINTPLLIQSDLCVVDSQLNVLSDSFWKYQNLDPASMNSLHVLLLQNYVTGCACLVNRSLLNLAKPIPREAIMHDWWLGLVARAGGRIVLMEERLVLYRQHTNNQVGARRWGLSMLIKSLNFYIIKTLRMRLNNKKEQAAALVLTGCLNDHDKRLTISFLELFDKGWFQRRIDLFKYKFHMNDVLRNIVLFLVI